MSIVMKAKSHSLVKPITGVRKSGEDPFKQYTTPSSIYFSKNESNINSTSTRFYNSKLVK